MPSTMPAIDIPRPPTRGSRVFSNPKIPVITATSVAITGTQKLKIPKIRLVTANPLPIVGPGEYPPVGYPP
jgi:hypothetical protein